MIHAATDPFEAMIREAGEGHLVDWHAPKADALPHLRELLRRADARARQRLGTAAPPLTPERLVEEYKHNPHKVRAFLQVLASVSPDMLVMVWRIIQGMAVAAIQLEYVAHAAFNLRVRLSSPYDPGVEEEYVSAEINDAIVLRHLGIMNLGEQRLFDGFYALNLKAP